MLPLIFALLFGMLFLGFPLFVVLLLPSWIVLYFFFPTVAPVVIPQQVIDGIRVFSLLAVPLFIFAGSVMSRGEIADRLVRFVLTLLGHIPGGLAHTTVGSCALFGAISGSTQATVASIGKVMHPRLLKAGYRDSFSLGLIVNASNLAALIPPSIILILYGINVRASIGQLFMAGIGPGLLVALLFIIYCYIWAKRNNVPLEKRANLREIVKATWDAKWALGMPVIILGGIYGGIFSPAETAAVSVVYAVFVETVIYKSLRWKDIPGIAFETASVNAIIFVLIGSGQLFSWLLTFTGFPQQLIQFVLGLELSRLTFLLFVNLVFFVACMFVDATAAIIVITPLIYPIAMKFQVHPIHLGMIIGLQSTIGAGTPPFGVNIFTACAVFKKNYFDVIKESHMFILILVIAAVLITVSPRLALFTHDIFYGH